MEQNFCEARRRGLQRIAFVRWQFRQTTNRSRLDPHIVTLTPVANLTRTPTRIHRMARHPLPVPTAGDRRQRSISAISHWTQGEFIPGKNLPPSLGNPQCRLGCRQGSLELVRRDQNPHGSHFNFTSHSMQGKKFSNQWEG